MPHLGSPVFAPWLDVVRTLARVGPGCGVTGTALRPDSVRTLVRVGYDCVGFSPDWGEDGMSFSSMATASSEMPWLMFTP